MPPDKPKALIARTRALRTYTRMLTDEAAELCLMAHVQILRARFMRNTLLVSPRRPKDKPRINGATIYSFMQIVAQGGGIDCVFLNDLP